MKYYENKIKHMSETPNKRYRNDAQAFLDMDWDNNILLYDKKGNKIIIKEEIEFGTFEFAEIEARKSTISEFILNEIKDSRDFRKLLFKDSTHEVGLGLFYQFENNYWITYDATESESVNSYIYVRQCNNVAKWIDKETGNIIEIPCVLGEDVASSKSKITGDYTNIANNMTTLWLQGNKNTLKLLVNQRFIFNGRPWKISGYSNYVQDNYVTKDVPMLFFDLYLDVKSINDDYENGIADNNFYDYEIIILENPIEQIQGFEGVLSAEVTLNEEVVDIKPEWLSMNDNGIIDQDGNYKIIGEVGTTATFKATIATQSTMVSILIKEVIEAQNDLVIEPLITELKQGRNTDIDVNLYVNGVKQSNEVTATLSGAEGHYEWNIIAHNKFNLKNTEMSSKPLMITFTSGEISETISIILRAML